MDASERLWEIHRIEQLKARYFRLMDIHDWEAFRELFTDDLTVWADETPTPTSTEPVATSADEFVRHVSTLLADATTVHHGHLPEIELTGPDTARGVWAMFDWVDAPTRGLTFQGYGHYHEEYARGDDDRWRISRLRLTRLRIVEPGLSVPIHLPPTIAERPGDATPKVARCPGHRRRRGLPVIGDLM